MKKALIFSIILFATTLVQAQDTFKDAQTQFENKKYKKALDLVNKDISDRGLTEDNAILKSEILMFVDADKCFESMQQAITAFPKSSRVFSLRARFYYELQDYKNTIKDETKAIELATVDTAKFWPLMTRSTCYSYLNLNDKAISDMREALVIKPNNMMALTNLSMALFHAGQTEESLKILLQVLAQDSTLIGTYINLGYQNQQLGNFAEAEKYLTMGLKVDANQPFLLNNLGFVQHKLGKTPEGIKNINKSLKIDPYNSYCYRNLALIHIDLNEKNKACEYIKKAIGLGYTKQYGPEMQELLGKHCL